MSGVLAAVGLAATACGSGATAATHASPRAAAAATAASTPEPLPAGFNANRDAVADVNAALALAAVDKRPVLLNFGADWCVYCVMLEHIFRNRPVWPTITKFHVVAIDVEGNRTADVAKKYGVDPKTKGIPVLVALSPTGDSPRAGSR
jgi:thiol:disulfide interchange protein